MTLEIKGKHVNYTTLSHGASCFAEWDNSLQAQRTVPARADPTGIHRTGDFKRKPFSRANFTSIVLPIFSTFSRSEPTQVIIWKENI